MVNQESRLWLIRQWQTHAQFHCHLHCTYSIALHALYDIANDRLTTHTRSNCMRAALWLKQTNNHLRYDLFWIAWFFSFSQSPARKRTMEEWKRPPFICFWLLFSFQYFPFFVFVIDLSASWMKKRRQNNDITTERQFSGSVFESFEGGCDHYYVRVLDDAMQRKTLASISYFRHGCWGRCSFPLRFYRKSPGNHSLNDIPETKYLFQVYI